MPQPLQLSDVRLSRYEVIAAPAWSFRAVGRGGRRWYAPILELWAPLMAELRRRLDADNAGGGHVAGGRQRVLPVGEVRRLSQCPACGRSFGARWRVRHCTDACADRAREKAAGRRPPRKSRAKEKETALCPCGVLFVKARGDARFCSTRCRVAAHRGGLATAPHGGRPLQP